MALMYCRECGKQVSSEAPACPHCGVPQPVYRAAPQSGFPQPLQQQYPAELQPQPVYMVHPAPRHDPTVAALLSFFMPGVGQMYKGEVGVGIAFLIGTVIGYLSCVIPGLVLHIFSIINAAKRD